MLTNVYWARTVAIKLVLIQLVVIAVNAVKVLHWLQISAIATVRICLIIIFGIIYLFKLLNTATATGAMLNHFIKLLSVFVKL